MPEIKKTDIKKLIGTEFPLILDIGCYDGSDSLELAEQFKMPEIHCFDADPRSCDLFTRLDPYNRFKRFLILHPTAVCNENGEIHLHLSDSKTRRHYPLEPWSASSSIRAPKTHLELFPDVSYDRSTLVRSTRLDTWYQQNLPTRTIDFIWCDVNGAEEDVIKGGLATLLTRTRYLYIEFSDKELFEGQRTKEELLALLPSFENLGVYNFEGNFGNILLKNKSLK